MPHIEQEIANCVFYALGPNPKTGEIEIGGTGFFVSRPSQSLTGLSHYYAVTNQHVYANYPIIRVNTSDGSTRPIETDQIDWEVKAQFDDLAVYDITDLIEFDKDQISAVPEAGFLIAQQSYFGMGDEVFMVGLFVNEPGTSRNYPKARFGNISAIADEGERIEQPNRVRRPTHIADMRSRTGFSGSPVFVFDAPHHIWVDDRWTLRLPNNNGLLKLLGIHCGFYEESAPLRVAPDDLREVRVPSSMNTVVPAWQITELLNSNKLSELRDKRDQERKLEHDKLSRPGAA